MKTDGPFKDKNGRVLEVGDIVRISDEWRAKTNCCHRSYGHIWLAEPWGEDDDPHEWVLSYNHTGSESSDRLKDVAAEHLEWYCKVKPDTFELDFPETP